MVSPRNPKDGLSAAPTAASAKERTAVGPQSACWNFPTNTARELDDARQDIAEYAFANGKSFEEN
jgi:hypothetical protein